MHFDELQNCPRFERDCMASNETYIPLFNIEFGWDGGDFRIYSIHRNGNSVVITAMQDDGEPGFTVTQLVDVPIELLVYDVVERL